MKEEYLRAAKKWGLSWDLLNLTVETYIHVGRYAEALQADTLWPPPAVGSRAGSRDNQALVVINQAEALYNLGRWDEAWTSIQPLLKSTDRQAPIVRSGVHTQAGWIAIHQGHLELAEQHLDQAKAEDLPVIYQSELPYTRAMLRLAQGERHSAMAGARAGFAQAKRASSVRNGLFLLARCESAFGHWEQALDLCSQAASHVYKGQGGDGLLFWGDLLAQTDRLTEARVAWGLAVERDPESESAAIARSRLQPSGMPTETTAANPIAALVSS